VTEKQTIQSDPNVLAIVHRIGTTSRVIVASARNGRPAVIEASEISGDESRLEPYLAKHRVSRVIHVLPNSYLVIQGYKNVQVNGENTRMYLTGIVNPLLIDRDHTVRSSQIADLQIRYGGEGVVAANQNPGLVSRILNFLWPF
jgi:flagellar L-ring protein precursor FlgH